MVRKLSIVGVCRLLANSIIFHSIILLFMWILVSSSLVVDRPIHHSTLSINVYRRLVLNL